jgi:hypothetical protein
VSLVDRWGNASMVHRAEELLPGFSHQRAFVCFIAERIRWDKSLCQRPAAGVRGTTRVSRFSHLRHFHEETCGRNELSSTRIVLVFRAWTKTSRWRASLHVRSLTRWAGEGEIMLKPNICALSVCPTESAENR